MLRYKFNFELPQGGFVQSVLVEQFGMDGSGVIQVEKAIQIISIAKMLDELKVGNYTMELLSE